MTRLTLGALVLLAVAVIQACVTLAPAAPAAPTGPLPTARPGATQPQPGQTNPPVQPPEQPTGNLCDKVTLAEVSAAAGGARAVLAEDYDQEGQCNWDVGAPNELGTPDAFLNLRRDFSNALDDQRTLFPGGEDVAVGDEGYWSPDVNVLYVRKGVTIYAVQVVVVDTEAIDARGLAIAVATAALPRL